MTRRKRMTPAGLLLIIGFCIIVIIAVIFDKSASKKFEANFKSENPVKANLKDMSITENGKLVFYLPSGTLVGYKVWNLNEIGYISTNGSKFSILDKNMNVMAGEYMTPSKKPVKEKAYKTFEVGVGNNVQEYVDFLKEQIGIQHTENE